MVAIVYQKLTDFLAPFQLKFLGFVNSLMAKS